MKAHRFSHKRPLYTVLGAAAIAGGAITLVATQIAGGSSDSLEPRPSSPATSMVSASVPIGSQPGDLEISLVNDHPDGPLLVDAEQMTLYTTEREADGEVRCGDECIEIWPPALVSAEPVVDAELVGRIGTVERTDGSVQATLEGVPLYRFSFDQEPGDMLGEGVEDAFGDTGFTWQAAVLAEASTSSAPPTLSESAVPATTPETEPAPPVLDYDY